MATRQRSTTPDPLLSGGSADCRSLAPGFLLHSAKLRSGGEFVFPGRPSRRVKDILRLAAAERPVVEADLGQDGHHVVGSYSRGLCHALDDTAIERLLCFGCATAREKDLDQDEIRRAPHA